MMKKKPPQKNILQIRQFCIELAMRWPSHDIAPHGAAYVPTNLGLSGAGKNYVDADIIGRAQKIESYILGK